MKRWFGIEGLIDFHESWLRVGKYWVGIYKRKLFIVPIIQGATAANFGQNDVYAFGDDNGSEATHSLDTENTNRTAQAADVTFMIRISCEENAGGNATYTHALFAQKNGAGGFTEVTTARADGLKIADDTQGRADDENTTNRLTAGAGTWQPGKYDDGQTQQGTTSFKCDTEYTELEFAIQIDSANAVNGDYWELRGEQLNGTDYNFYPGTYPTVTASIAAAQSIPLDTLQLQSSPLDIIVSAGAATIPTDTLELNALAQLSLPSTPIRLKTLKLTATRPYPNLVDVDFETGDLSELDTVNNPDNDLTVSQDAAMFGNHGLEILIDDATAVNVGKDINLSGESYYYGQIWINPNSLTMNNGDSFGFLFTAVSVSPWNLFYIDIARTDQYYLNLIAVEDDTTTHASGYQTLPNSPTKVEWLVKRGAGDGQFQAWINDVLVYNISDLDNDTAWDNTYEVYFGVSSNVDYPTTQGTFYVDKLCVSTESIPSIVSPTNVVAGAVITSLDTLLLSAIAPDVDIITIAPLTVVMDTLLLDSTANDVAFAPGAISQTLNTLLLQSFANDLAVIAGAATISTDTLFLNGTANDVTISPEAVSTLLDTLLLQSSLLDLSVILGAATVSLDTLQLLASTPDIDIPPSLLLNTLILQSVANDLNVSPSAVSTVLDTLLLQVSAPDLDILLGAASVLLDTLQLSASAPNITISPDTVSLQMDTLELSVSTPDIEISTLAALSIALDTLLLQGSPQAINISPSAVSIDLDTLLLNANANNINVLLGAVAIIMDTLALNINVVDLNISPGAVSTLLDTLLLQSNTVDIAFAPGAVTTSLDTLLLQSFAQDITISVPAPVVSLDTLELQSFAISTTIVPAATTLSLDTLLLNANALDIIAQIVAATVSGGVAVSDSLISDILMSDELISNVSITDSDNA